MVCPEIFESNGEAPTNAQARIRIRNLRLAGVPIASRRRMDSRHHMPRWVGRRWPNSRPERWMAVHEAPTTRSTRLEKPAAASITRLNSCVSQPAFCGWDDQGPGAERTEGGRSGRIERLTTSPPKGLLVAAKRRDLGPPPMCKSLGNAARLVPAQEVTVVAAARSPLEARRDPFRPLSHAFKV